MYISNRTFSDDHSRVILESTDNEDYINANFIRVSIKNILNIGNKYKTAELSFNLNCFEIIKKK